VLHCALVQNDQKPLRTPTYTQGLLQASVFFRDPPIESYEHYRYRANESSDQRTELNQRTNVCCEKAKPKQIIMSEFLVLCSARLFVCLLGILTLSKVRKSTHRNLRVYPQKTLAFRIPPWLISHSLQNKIHQCLREFLVLFFSKPFTLMSGKSRYTISVSDS
jgi:hypothetical protein